MAIGGVACLASTVANGLVSSLLWTSNRRSFVTPVSYLRTLASTHAHRNVTCISSSSNSHSRNRRFKSQSSASSAVAPTTNTCSPNGYPEYSRLLPCPSQSGPPRVEHLVVSEGGPVLEYICKALDLPPLLVSDLIIFGAVYYALVCPDPPPSATQEQIRVYEEVTDPSVLENRPFIKGKPEQGGQKTLRITRVNEFVEAGTYLRVHVHPKRFPRFVSDLINFGAVYYALVCPQPPPSATPEQIRAYKEATDPSVLRNRPSIKGKTVREAQKTFRITHVNEPVEAGTYLRVHVHPKRFPRCYEIDWKSRIIAVSDSYVVLGKPAGISVGGTTDNIEESCATFATRALGLTSPLKTTHQIDNCTEGCVVFARTKEYCSVFHGKIREKQVKKLYLALVAAPVAVGVITHYMRPINIAPRLVSKDFIKGWHLCQLEVLKCEKVPWPDSAIEEKYSVEDCGWPTKDFAYECKINLLTGKTHQVRAQLAACGAPIVGDLMYMPAAIAEMGSPGINPFGECKKQFASESDQGLAVEEWIAQHGKEPSVAIGLQACQISWDDGAHFYEARSPWWR